MYKSIIDFEYSTFDVNNGISFCPVNFSLHRYRLTVVVVVVVVVTVATPMHNHILLDAINIITYKTIIELILFLLLMCTDSFDNFA